MRTCLAAAAPACACRVLIASIMEECNKAAWEELVERCQEAGVDAFEVNFRWTGRCRTAVRQSLVKH